MFDIFDKAAMLHKEANKIIYELGLDSILNRYSCEVFYTGSYYLNVMAWSDLDISIVLKDDYKNVSTFMEITKEIGLLKGVKKINYRNHLKNDKDGILPQGFYDGVYIESGSMNWKIDLWAVNHENIIKYKDEMNRINNLIDEDKRKLILEVKNSLITEEGRTPLFSGYNIYKAVVDLNIKSEEKVIDYLKEIGILQI